MHLLYDGSDGQTNKSGDGFFQLAGYGKEKWEKAEIYDVPRFNIGNAGATPTKALTYGTNCIWNDSPLESPFDSGNTNVVPEYTLGPKITDGPIPACPPPSALGANLYVFGWAKYRDRLETGDEAEHETQFCWWLKPAEKAGPCKHHNCTDEECRAQK